MEIEVGEDRKQEEETLVGCLSVGNQVRMERGNCAGYLGKRGLKIRHTAMFKSLHCFPP